MWGGGIRPYAFLVTVVNRNIRVPWASYWGGRKGGVSFRGGDGTALLVVVAGGVMDYLESNVGRRAIEAQF